MEGEIGTGFEKQGLELLFERRQELRRLTEAGSPKHNRVPVSGNSKKPRPMTLGMKTLASRGPVTLPDGS